MQALFFGGGWVFFMRKLFKNFEVCVMNSKLYNNILAQLLCLHKPQIQVGGALWVMKHNHYWLEQ